MLLYSFQLSSGFPCTSSPLQSTSARDPSQLQSPSLDSKLAFFWPSNMPHLILSEHHHSFPDCHMDLPPWLGVPLTHFSSLLVPKLLFHLPLQLSPSSLHFLWEFFFFWYSWLLKQCRFELCRSNLYVAFFQSIFWKNFWSFETIFCFPWKIVRGRLVTRES